MKKKIIFGLFSLALAFALIFAGCNFGVVNTPKPIVHAQEPDVSAWPEDDSYFIGETIKPLVVEASSVDGGQLFYQWWEITDYGAANEDIIPIEGATESRFTPVLPTAKIYYFCVQVINVNNALTGNKKADIWSDTITIVMENGEDAQYPNIIEQPKSSTITWKGPGTVIPTLEIIASLREGSTGVLDYQWYSNTQPNTTGAAMVPGEEGTRDYLIPNITDAGIYYYFVKVINTDDRATGQIKVRERDSDVVTIRVEKIPQPGKPVITTQPQSATTYLTLPISQLTVAASKPTDDDGTLTYQWYSNTSNSATGWEPIEGATGTSYMPPVSNAVAGTYYYYVIVTNTYSYAAITTNTTTSNVAVIAVQKVAQAAKPVITTQPQDGTTAFNIVIPPLTVTAAEPTDPTNDGVLTYQWYSNTTNSTTGGEPIGGATGTSYTPTVDNTKYGVHYFYVVVTNTYPYATTTTNTTTSRVAVKTVQSSIANAQTPTISAQPQGKTYLTGSTIDPLTVGVTAPTDGGTLSYQWYSNSVNSTSGGTAVGTNSTSYPPTVSTASAGTYYYYVVVTNTNSSANNPIATTTSSVVIIRIIDPPANAQTPVISAQPQNKTVGVNGAMTAFTVTATEPTDGGTLSYQWYSTTAASGGTPTLINGATNASYTPTVSTASTGTYYYYVIVTNTNTLATNQTASTTSNVATLTIQVSDPTPTNIFTVNTGTKYQYVRGFGGMDTPWENVVPLTIANYEKMYHPGILDDPGNTSGVNGLGFNILRIMLMPWNVDPDVTMTTLTTDPNGGPKKMYRPDQYEGVKIVNRYGGYVFGCPWSPPAAWKTNNSTAGNGANLKTANYKDFANYLNAYGWNFYNHGAPLYAISMQNEPSYTNNGDYEGCEYTSAQHLAWWQAVGHFARDAASNKSGATPAPGYGGGQAFPYVKTMSGEAHNEVTYLDNVANNSTVNANIDIMGRHIYGAGIDPSGAALKWGSSVRTARENAGRETWMTEHNVNGGSASSYPNDSTWGYIWKFMNEVDLVIRLNKENAFIWWTAKRFYSFIGDDKGQMNNGSQCNGYSTTLDAVLPRAYAMSHYAKFAKEMRQCAITCKNASGTDLSTSVINPTSYGQDNTAAKATAFVSEDGNTISVVMMTPTTTSGGSGQNLGTVKIQLPAGFIISKAVAMRTTGTSNTARTVNHATESVTIGADRNSAYVTMPANNILSVRFTK